MEIIKWLTRKSGIPHTVEFTGSHPPLTYMFIWGWTLNSLMPTSYGNVWSRESPKEPNRCSDEDFVSPPPTRARLSPGPCAVNAVSCWCSSWGQQRAAAVPGSRATSTSSRLLALALYSLCACIWRVNHWMETLSPSLSLFLKFKKNEFNFLKKTK